MRGRYLAVVFVAGSLTQCGGRSLSGDDLTPTADGPVKKGGTGNVGNPARPAGGAAAQGGQPSGFAGSAPVIPGPGGMSAYAGSGGVLIGMAGTSSGGSPSDPCLEVPGVSCSKNEYGFAFQSFYYLAACTEVQGPDCLLVQGGCPSTSIDFDELGVKSREEFKFGGELGKFYNVTIRVNGIVEGKYYRNGKRRGGDNFSDANNPAGTDTFYVGGEPLPSKYGVYKLSVFQADGTTEVDHYYLNSFPEQSGFESHQTFPIGYEAVIQVPGGGVIKRLYQDADCRAYNNCGPGDSASNCPAARNVPNEPGLQVPAMYGGVATSSLNVINGAMQPWHAQMVHVTVTKVELAP